jgi:transposase
MNLIQGVAVALSDAGIEALYDRGLSCAQIAEIDGRSEGTIYNRLTSRGVSLRSRSEANKKFSDGAAMTLYNLGLSCAQIGCVFGVHRTTVLKRLQACSLPCSRSPTPTGTGTGVTPSRIRPAGHRTSSTT